MSGTITSNNMNLASSATVSLTSNGVTTTKQVSVPAPDGTGAQLVTYSFSGVENVTVDVKLTASSNNNWNSGQTVSCAATQDANALSPTISGDNPKVFTLPGVSITNSTTIDVQICSPVFTSGTYTVSGTITSSNLELASDATVALSSSGVSVTKHVTLPPPDGTGAQVVTYSFSGVEDIAADVTLTATSAIWNSPDVVGCSFTRDGGSPVTETPSGTTTKVFTFPGVDITGSTTINVQLFPTIFTNGTNTVGGNIRSDNMDLAPDGTIALTSNGITVTQHVTFPAPDGAGTQIVAYSFSGLENIAPDLTLTATSQNNWDPLHPLQFSFSQSGSGPATVSGTGATKVFTLPGVSITQPTTIDVTLNHPLIGPPK